MRRMAFGGALTGLGYRIRLAWIPYTRLGYRTAAGPFDISEISCALVDIYLLIYNLYLFEEPGSYYSDAVCATRGSCPFWSPIPAQQALVRTAGKNPLGSITKTTSFIFIGNVY